LSITIFEGARLLPPFVFSTGPLNSHSSYISAMCDLNGRFHDTSASCSFDVQPPGIDNLFQNDDDDDDTDPFEGFDEQDVQMGEDILANISSYNEAAIEVSEDEGEIDSDLEETKESDYDSPGH
jgi:hypothetical protein